jgi:hypothetical protein
MKILTWTRPLCYQARTKLKLTMKTMKGMKFLFFMIFTPFMVEHFLARM